LKKNPLSNIDFSRFSDCRILVIGDLMIDEYIWGDVDRISPEAPVPVVLVKSENFTLGGSGNVIHNLAALGAQVTALGIIGTGRNGNRVLKKLEELGVDTEGVIRDPDRPTIQKTRIIAVSQHVLRIDREIRKDVPYKTRQKLIAAVKKLVSRVDMVLVSDYGKGLVSHPLLYQLVKAARAKDKFVIADPKGFNFEKYAGVSLLTPNKKEAGIAAGVEIVDVPSLKEAAATILASVDIGRLIVTLGKDGMALFERGKRPYTIRAQARQVYDVSGAGDTVLAVLGLGLAAGASLETAMRLANTAAGIVVGKVGTAAVTLEELKTTVYSGPVDRAR